MILSDEEILQVMTTDVVEGDYYLPHSFARAIEAAILEKIGEPVAWRTFDDEGGWDFRSYEYNESYMDEHMTRNPNPIYRNWVQPLYALPKVKE